MAHSKSRPPARLAGQWLIVSMDERDAEDWEEDPAFIEFGADQLGSFRVGLTTGTIDYRITERGSRPGVEWTWEGTDEMEPCSGRGWAVLDGGELHGMIFFHQGDESSFVAKRAGKRARRQK